MTERSRFVLTMVLGIVLRLVPLPNGLPDAGAEEQDPAAVKDNGARKPAKVHLFLLSGQSNMVGLREKTAFAPIVRKAFPNDEVIVVKVARNNLSITHWYADGKPQGVYKDLLKRGRDALGDKKPDTITFVWMQGEADAKRKGKGGLYVERLKGLIQQLRTDMKREDVNVVIGRINDFKNSRLPDWNVIRKALAEIAEADPRAAWIDTDDLNGSTNWIHFTKQGYRKLGIRFATTAVELIQNDRKRGEPENKPPGEKEKTGKPVTPPEAD